jgi:hypothetical protein
MLGRPQHYVPALTQDMVTGQAIAKSHWTPRERAHLAAGWKSGILNIAPTTKMAATTFGVSVPLVDAAIKELEPAIPKRKNGASAVAAIARLWSRLMGLVPWLEKFFQHKNGVALVPDRTSCPWWQRFVPQADLVLFVAPKIKFVDAHGREGRSPAQGTCLLAAGARGVEALHRAAPALGVLMTPTHHLNQGARNQKKGGG